MEESIHKEQITYFLRLILTIAGNEIQQGKDFEKRFAERLNFQSENDWRKYLAAIDLFDDTEYAIISTFEYQLGDINNKNRDFNGIYLRLYGILNAVYLQMSALEEISILLKYPLDIREVRKLFRELDIYKLRNIAGAHTLNFNSSKEFLGNSKQTSFRIIAANIEETGNNITVISQNGQIVKYNLIRILSDYEKKATTLLIELVKLAIKNLVNDRDYRTELEILLGKRQKKLIDYSKINKNKVRI